MPCLIHHRVTTVTLFELTHTCTKLQKSKNTLLHIIYKSHRKTFPIMPFTAGATRKRVVALQRKTVENNATLTLKITLNRFTVQTCALCITSVLRGSLRILSQCLALNIGTTFRSGFAPSTYLSLSAPSADFSHACTTARQGRSLTKIVNILS